MKIQLLIVVLLGLALNAAGTGASTTDISGTWKCSIDRPAANGGPITATFVFKQAGEKLTGTFTDSVIRREEPLTGTLKGDKAVFSYELKPPGDVKVKKPGLIVTFNGTLETQAKMSGSIGSPYCAAGCKWTATKK